MDYNYGQGNPYLMPDQSQSGLMPNNQSNPQLALLHYGSTNPNYGLQNSAPTPITAGQNPVAAAVGSHNNMMQGIGKAIQQAAQQQQLQQLYQPRMQYQMMPLNTQLPQYNFYNPMPQLSAPQMLMSMPHSSPYNYPGFQNGA